MSVAGLPVILSPSVADYVYFENSSSNPYLIRRIEELNKVMWLLVGPRFCMAFALWGCG